MVDVYHELEFPCEVLESIVRALKPGGRVAFVEYRGEDDNVPIKALHKMTERQIRLEAGKHSLALGAHQPAPALAAPGRVPQGTLETPLCEWNLRAFAFEVAL